MQLITGDKFKNLPKITFCKIDDIKSFIPPTIPYILVTHNGDLPITKDCEYILNDPNLIKWFGINTMIIHPKLETIPIGICYEDKTNHPGDLQIDERERMIKACMGSIIHKSLILSNVANLRIREMPHRIECEKALNSNGIKNVDSYQFGDYLVNLKKSLFTPCPQGLGIDTFRLWESLYMKSIPICTLTDYNKDLYKQLPIYWMSSWEDFNINHFDIELYLEMWFDSPLVDFNYWKNKIDKLWT